jgi:hypothetical protein
LSWLQLIEILENCLYSIRNNSKFLLYLIIKIFRICREVVLYFDRSDHGMSFPATCLPVGENSTIVSFYTVWFKILKIVSNVVFFMFWNLQIIYFILNVWSIKFKLRYLWGSYCVKCIYLFFTILIKGYGIWLNLVEFPKTLLLLN